jgi:hypothetical protein
MAKAARTPESQENQQVEAETPLVQEFELWNVEVTFKRQMDPETFEVVTIHEFSKKGDKALRSTFIEQRHADILNEQSVNSKQRYYAK